VAAITASFATSGCHREGALKDGSGLGPAATASPAPPRGDAGLADRPEFAVLHDGCPVAGRKGTLYDQFLGTSLVGNFGARPARSTASPA